MVLLYIARPLNPFLTLKKYIHWYLFLILMLLVGGAMFVLHGNHLDRIEQAKSQKLEYIHNRAVNQFTASVDRMAGLVAGMRSFINMSNDIPSQEVFQQFIQNQLDDIHSNDSIAVTVIDTAHVFKQAFTRNENDPVQLIGRSVKDFRGKEKIRALDSLMMIDDLKMYPPINLVEGWLGIPINFRIHRQGITQGYVAPILNFRSIMTSVYDDEIAKDFVFKFSTELGNTFDRTQSYNNTKVYHELEDPEYYKNFNIAEDAFISSQKEYYGFGITIGTAYKKQGEQESQFLFWLIAGYIIFGGVLFIITWQSYRNHKLNKKLLQVNSEVEKQNTQLHKLNATKNKFFSIISHDIKQPLHAIEGLLYLLESKKTDDPSLITLFKAIRKSTGRTLNLLNNLLKWALSQTGDIIPDLAVVRLSDLIQETVEVIQHQAVSKSIDIQENLDDTIKVSVDRDMTRTVLRNLLSNAVKYTPDKGMIHIRSFIEKNNVFIEVKDTGIGMEPKLVKKLFNIGEKVTRKDTSGMMGTGLGLILCKDFIEKQGGDISVQSVVGEGSTFSITFPSIID